jgi:hypothetical protein
MRLMSTGLNVTDEVNGDTIINAQADGAVELYYDNSPTIETYAGGCQMGGDLAFSDSQVANFGTGSDLQIYHNGSNSFIENGTGELLIRAKTGENSINCNPDGAVELYFDNSKKLETTSVGMRLSGNYQANDGYHIYLGTGNDLDIDHDGTHNQIMASSGYIKVQATNESLYLRGNTAWIQDGSGDENYIKCIDNGAVELYYDNSKKFETTTSGATVTGSLLMESGHIYVQDGYEVKFGASDDLKIYHNGSDSYIEETGTGALSIKAAPTIGIRSATVNINTEANSENMARFFADGAVELYHNNSKKFETTGDSGGGIKVFNDILIPDNGVIRLGAASGGDLKIYHDGTSNLIRNVGSTDMYINLNTTEVAAKFTANGNVELYYDNSKKLETTSAGVSISGGCLPSANSSYDLGSSSYRWNNIYVNDMHFSNEGSTNSVDGTWGDWTLQEGEEDIFMINNRSGKKYKFNLTEVS